jgi:hypothetical protein
MAKVTCCRRAQSAQVFKIVPTRKDVFEEYVFYLEKCSFCKRPALEIIRVNLDGKILSPVRLKTTNIPRFISTAIVLWKPKKLWYLPGKTTRLKLYYNDFGSRKICFQNFSNLKMGKIENDPLLGLKEIIKSKNIFKNIF